jgi:hypothetical protein
MGLAPSGQQENTANLLYAEVPVPIDSHRQRAEFPGQHPDGRFIVKPLQNASQNGCSRFSLY